jgi:hypothetical protein
MKKLIEKFLSKYGTEVYDMPLSDLELKMDNHVCVEWEDKEYFILKDNSFYTDVDELILEYLRECC